MSNPNSLLLNVSFQLQGNYQQTRQLDRQFNTRRSTEIYLLRHRNHATLLRQVEPNITQPQPKLCWALANILMACVWLGLKFITQIIWIGFSERCQATEFTYKIYSFLEKHFIFLCNFFSCILFYILLADMFIFIFNKSS